MAPHLVRPLPFLLPLYGAGLVERAKLKAGLTLYDLLSFDRNRLEDPSQHLPGHRWMNRKDALAREPVLAGDGFEGAFEYHDAQMYSPERIALENLIDADAHGAAIANYVSADRLMLRDGKVEGCSVHETMAGTCFDIRAKTVLVAAGPWADLFLEQATGEAAAHKLIRSKGIHVMVPAYQPGSADHRGRHRTSVRPALARPYLARHHRHALYRRSRHRCASAKAISKASSPPSANTCPLRRLARDKVEFFYAGLRPLVSDGSKDSYNVSRRSELVDHGKEGALDGVFSALGGKWTTSRALAEKITDALAAKLDKKTPRCATATTPLPGGRFDRFEEMVKGFQKTWPGISSLRHMAHMLGARLPEALKGARLTDLAKLGASGDTPAQIGFALREEMALTLEDMVMRRTGIGQFGPPSRAVTEKVAAQMAAYLGWDADKTAREIDSLAPLYRTHA